MIYKLTLGWFASVLLGVGMVAPVISLVQPAAADTVRGSGTFRLEGRSDVAITGVSYRYGSEYNRTLVFMLADGRNISLGGHLLEGQKERFQVESSGDANASGILTISYVDDNPVTISGRGLLDGQQYSINFSRGGSGTSS
ncbi:MAG TPA: hypothetical protein V6C57_09330 [Coleofasciculaceae cyanobacterium]